MAGGFSSVGRFRQGALRRRETLFRRLTKARPVARDARTLLRRSSSSCSRQFIGARELLRRAALALLGLLGVLPRLQDIFVDFPNESSTWSAMASYSASNLSR